MKPAVISCKNQSDIQRKNKLYKQLLEHWQLYVMVLPALIYLIIFAYKPMYGVIIAFKDYSMRKGILGSDWVGFINFTRLFSSYWFPIILKNTVTISLLSLIVGFPAPILLALMVNEIKSEKIKRTFQTVSYAPHFISTVVIVGMIVEFSSVDGIFNDIRATFGLDRIPLMAKKEYFRTLYVGSGIWQGLGWGSIIYLAALSGVSPTLYDVADIDGANRWQKMIHITWPAIKPTTTILLILNLGGILGVGFQKILLMYNTNVMEVADVISTYVYREGIQGARFEYTTAIGLFISAISFVFVYSANLISRKVSENSLW